VCGACFHFGRWNWLAKAPLILWLSLPVCGFACPKWKVVFNRDHAGKSWCNWWSCFWSLPLKYTYINSAPIWLKGGMITSNKGTSELEKKQRSAFKVKPGSRGRKYNCITFLHVLFGVRKDSIPNLSRTWSTVTSTKARKEVNGPAAPPPCFSVCRQLPHGVKQFVSLTLFDHWEKQMQQKNCCTGARTKILLISFLANENNGHAKFLAFQASTVDVGLVLQKLQRSAWSLSFSWTKADFKCGGEYESHPD